MPTPFPGMDPYLGRSDLWPDVHNSLITALRDELAPLVRPRYCVSIEERMYLGGSGHALTVPRWLERIHANQKKSRSCLEW